MNIAIISFGSLIQTGEDRGLLINGQWHADGPILPIEFSRISQGGERAGCLTLVIDEQHGTNVPTKYAESFHTNLNDAIQNLREVEGIKPEKAYTIGYVNLRDNKERRWSRIHTPVSCNTIRNWAIDKSFDAVVWVGLLPNFERITETPYSVENAIHYIEGLTQDVFIKTVEYIENSPAEIMTQFRQHNLVNG